MTIRILVNVALLAIPIAVTLGILFGLQSHRDATGQPPLFAPQPPPIPTPAPPKPPKNGVTKTRYCQKSYGITPDTTGQKYICRCRAILFAMSPAETTIFRRIWPAGYIFNLWCSSPLITKEDSGLIWSLHGGCQYAPIHGRWILILTTPMSNLRRPKSGLQLPCFSILLHFMNLISTCANIDPTYSTDACCS